MLLIRHWPVAARVAGAADVLYLPFLLHGLTDAGDVTCKLRVRANCWVEGQCVPQDSKHSLTLVPVGPCIVTRSLGFLTQHLGHDTVHVGADQAQTVQV